MTDAGCGPDSACGPCFAEPWCTPPCFWVCPALQPHFCPLPAMLLKVLHVHHLLGRSHSVTVVEWRISSLPQDLTVLTFLFIFALLFLKILFYMYSPPWSPLPPPSPPDPSGPSQCTSPKHLFHASNLGWWSVSPLIIYMFWCCSL